MFRSAFVFAVLQFDISTDVYSNWNKLHLAANLMSCVYSVHGNGGI